jgi:hypothetical protein
LDLDDVMRSRKLIGPPPGYRPRNASIVVARKAETALHR